MRELRTRLGRLARRWPVKGERGAAGVLVAILIAGGVLIAMGALVVDVGQVYQNRAELQNGADGGALGVARSCALAGTCDTTQAAPYANANASKLTNYQATATVVCGFGGNLSSCPAGTGTGALTDCPAAPTGGIKYVDVHTETGASPHLLPPVFAKTILGNQNYNGTTVFACAQAEWGPPANANTIAFTISACTWDNATSQGSLLADYPPTVPPASYDQVLRLHGSPGNTNPQGCPTEPAGADGPGNFGWTDDNGLCTVLINNNQYGGNTGTSTKPDCATALRDDWQNKTVIFVPVYVTIVNPGTNSVYTLKDFAGFVITGYNIPGGHPKSESDWLNPSNDCKGNDFCINGFFTRAIYTGGGTVGGGPDLGLELVRLSG